MAFHAVQAVTCATESRTRADGSQATVAVAKTATDVGQLTGALNLPSREYVGDTVCRAVGWVAPWLFLVDVDGRWIHPEVPRDGCGMPRSEAGAALDGLQQTTKELATVRIDESAEAVRAGCGQQWKDMIVETMDQPGSSPKPAAIDEDPFAGRPVRRCVYEFGGEPGDSGSFARGGPLSTSDRQAITAAMVGSASATAGPCSRPASEFAVLHRIDDAGPTVYIELGECRRILVSADSDSIALAGNDLIELLR